MSNEQMRQHWTETAGGWVENEAIFDAAFAPATEAILDAAGLQSGQRLLDVGCGSGTLLRAAADRGLQPVGLDISPAMVAAARARVREATVIVGDAQTLDLGADAAGQPFDRVVSRFGVMFFEDPTAAFANIARSCATGATMTFCCWRTREENPIFTLGTELMTAHLDQQPEPSPPGQPGPTAFAEPDRLRSVLAAAGWMSTSIDPLDFVCDYGGADGPGPGEGVEQRLATILATGTGRDAREQLVAKLGESGWQRVLEETRAALAEHAIDGVVRFPAATWLVQAKVAGRADRVPPTEPANPR